MSKSRNLKHKNAVLTVLIIVLTAVALWLTRGGDVQTGRLDVFAQCLRDKGVVMYGAEWCSHCQAQKQLFGQSFEYVNYVECPQDPKKCLGVGIEGYPTWITAGGVKLVGEQKLEDLSRISGCSLPADL